MCLSGCARSGAARAITASRIGWPRSAASASASSCSARSGAATARATARWRARRARSASHASRPATSTPTTPTAPACRTRSSPRACSRRSTRPSRSGAATVRRRWCRRPRWRPASPSIRTRWRRPRASRSGSSSTSRAISATAIPGSHDPDADRNLAELCRAKLAERYPGAAEQREAADRLEEELRVIRTLGLSGFFLLHHDMLELARDVAAEVRGLERRARGCCRPAAAAARASARSSAT